METEYICDDTKTNDDYIKEFEAEYGNLSDEELDELVKKTFGDNFV